MNRVEHDVREFGVVGGGGPGEGVGVGHYKIGLLHILGIYLRIVIKKMVLPKSHFINIS